MDVLINIIIYVSCFIFGYLVKREYFVFRPFMADFENYYNLSAIDKVLFNSLFREYLSLDYDEVNQRRKLLKKMHRMLNRKYSLVD